MKKIIFNIAIGVVTSFLFGSCNDFLDVKPEDRMISEQVYSSEGGIYSAWNGVYMHLSKNNLYGANLTMTTMDILAQRYSCGSASTIQHTYYNLANYKYKESNVKSVFDNIWTEAYLGIMETNDFIKKLENTTDVISESKKNILLGEAYGIRAFLHFDMLRIFGPIYASADSSAISIPYYRNADAQLVDLLPANQVMDSIMTDLGKAEMLLQKDPVITEGVLNVPSENPDPINDFYRYRNRRFNYYAIKALQARAYLYRRDKASALVAAKVFTGEPGSSPIATFPWTPYSKVVSSANPDRIFSSEVIFGIRNQDLYNNSNDFFSAALTNTSILAPFSQRLDAVYENLRENDYRYNSHWKISTEGIYDYRTFFKYASPQNLSASIQFAYFQPIIRLTEMYYIAAECEPDKARALKYLNMVRYNRGLVDLAATATLTTELTKEYQKEFYGEGQLFYYYKRIYAKSIPTGGATTGNISVGPAFYVIPLPDSETSLR